MQRGTQWLHDARWGVMTHFLARLPGPAIDNRIVTAQEWNEQVDSVDVEAMADTLADLGAGYLILTLGQLSGHFCSPNAAIDRIGGITPSLCSRRDLPAEMARALRKRGLRLIAYIHSEPPHHEQCRDAFETTQAAREADRRRLGMQRKWQSVIAEWSARWGDLVSGWWVDGCYDPPMYKSLDEPNWHSFAAALRAGNEQSLLAFNHGIMWPPKSITDEDDYLAGEVDGAFFAGYWEGSRYCQVPAIYQGVRLHILSFLGTMWCQGDAPRFPDEFVAGYTKFIASRGGATTWDVPIERDCTIRESFMPQLKAIGQAVARASRP
ncbi:MAG: hypothetical protein LLG01_03265 [Planctomycetaceae bacterium]|nr:hypothetical protein [Planctomycetaceae bacterium]